VSGLLLTLVTRPPCGFGGSLLSNRPGGKQRAPQAGPALLRGRCLPPLGRRITSFQPRRENLVCRDACLVQGNPAIRANGKFAQLRAGTTGAIKNYEHLSSLWRDLYA
jgi:hypothetical protein